MELSTIFQDNQVDIHALKLDPKIATIDSTLQFNQKGDLFFTDALYFTQWSMNESVFRTITLFYTKRSEYYSQFLSHFKGEQFRHIGIHEDMSANVLGEYATPFHRNKHLEFCYVVSGEMKIKIHDQDMLLIQGDALMLDSQTFHADYIRQDECQVIFIGINKQLLDENLCNHLHNVHIIKFLRSAFLEKKPVSDVLHFLLHTKNNAIELILVQLYTELVQKNSGYEWIIKGLLIRLFNTLSRDFSAKHITSTIIGNRQLLFNEVEKYISRNYAQMTLKDLAYEMNYSEDYFNRLIQEMVGCTYNQYLQTVRLEMAKTKLRMSDAAVYVIAGEVGYTSESYFYRLFLKTYGITPSQYRKQR